MKPAQPQHRCNLTPLARLLHLNRFANPLTDTTLVAHLTSASPIISNAIPQLLTHRDVHPWRYAALVRRVICCLGTKRDQAEAALSLCLIHSTLQPLNFFCLSRLRCRPIRNSFATMITCPPFNISTRLPLFVKIRAHGKSPTFFGFDEPFHRHLLDAQLYCYGLP